jgi:hypothetical protein
MRLRPSSHSRKGMAVMEFAMCSVFLVPLLLGIFVFGFRLIRSLQMIQVTRDLGHMYVRGVNFRNSGPIANAQTLASGYNLTSTGTSVVYLSQLKVIQQADCDAAGTAPAGTHCTNLGQTVFTEQLTIGNSGMGASPFGAPPLQTDSTVSVADQANNSASVAGGFSPILTLNAGETAYLAEMINQTADLNVPGFSGMPQVYARAIF